MGLNQPATNTESSKTKQEIDPRLDKPSESVLDALMGYASQNPWDMEYTGGRMAAMNQAQKDVMNASAGMGQALGFNATSAAEGLPQETMINGVPVYDALAQAKLGLSPEMQDYLSKLYGGGGLFSDYRLTGKEGADARQQQQQQQQQQKPKYTFAQYLRGAGDPEMTFNVRGK